MFCQWGTAFRGRIEWFSDRKFHLRKVFFRCLIVVDDDDEEEKTFMR